MIRIGATAAANSKEKQINRTINADLDFSKAKSLIDQVLSLETFSDVLQWDREASELVEHLLKRKGVWAQKFIEEAPVQ